MRNFSKVAMAICGVAAIGTIGYGMGVHNQQEQVAEKKVSSVKSIKSSKKSSKSSLSSISSSSSLSSQSSQVSSESSTASQGNGQLYDANNKTFAGYHNIHELWNSGYTVTSYLIKKCGYTADQAHEYIRQNFDEISPFLGSGELQTYYQNSNNTNNASGPSMHEASNGEYWETDDGHVYEHFDSEQIASIEAAANEN